MAETKFCPLTKAACKKEQCAWWDYNMITCAITSMMLALWADVFEDIFEDMFEDDDQPAIEHSNNDEFAAGSAKEYAVRIKKLD
ncbi:MAG: hypothetical protein HQP61_08645 [Peptococcaceae bacterium]|nr:hypothetical protein [Candidatus Syntrophopropionicum ammoniitolerans]